MLRTRVARAGAALGAPRQIIRLNLDAIGSLAEGLS